MFRGWMLGFVLQTLSNICLPSDNFFHVVLILDAARMFRKAKQVREHSVTGVTALSVGVRLSDTLAQVVGANAEHGDFLRDFAGTRHRVREWHF